MTEKQWPHREKEDITTLGDLGNPQKMTGPLDLNNHASDLLKSKLNDMLVIRIVEEALADMIESGDVVCPVHLTIGQEAVAVAVAHHLRTTDRAFGCHRSHGHYLAMGGGVQPLLDEVLGKASGCSKGMGGSMHLTAKEAGFYGSVPIVAGTVPLAVGAGLAAKKQGNGDIGVAFFGDGACEEGVVNESLNMASALDIPTLFVVENNLFSSHLDIHLRQPTDRVTRFAEANHVKALTLDGNDLVTMMDQIGELVDYIRTTNKPGFVEAITYRWRGHVGPKEDVDVGLRRSVSELNAWKQRDPIRRLVDALIERKAMNSAEFKALESAIRADINIAKEKAHKAPWPKEKTLLEAVYA